jgi:flagellar protein FliJ
MQSLQTLLAHEEERRDQAQARFQQAQARVHAAQAQAGQLALYRTEYQQRWRAEFGRGGSIQVMHCYRDFLARLDQAVAQQQRALEQAHLQAGRMREQLQAHELRVASVRKLMERRLAEQQRSDARREQKQSDEAASRAAFLGSNAWAQPSGLGAL